MGYLVVTEGADGSIDRYDAGMASSAALSAVECEPERGARRVAVFHHGRIVAFWSQRLARPVLRARYGRSRPGYMLESFHRARTARLAGRS